jgi:uncharacterized membrane protein/protein-disulfide isomerase
MSAEKPSSADSRSAGRRKPRPTVVWLARVTALVAAAIGGYLLWASLAAAGHVAGCGDDGGPDCGSVLLSRWSSWIGLPVGLPAVGAYMAMFGLLFCIEPGRSARTQRDAWGILVPLATLAAGAAVWFIALQLLALKSFCPYCMAIHACGLALAMFVFWFAPIHWRSARALDSDPIARTLGGGVVLILVGFVGVGGLIGGQIAIAPPSRKHEIIAIPVSEGPKLGAKPSESMGCTGAAGASAGPTPESASRPVDDPWAKPGPHRRIALAGGRATVDVNEVPILGDPGAKNVVVELFDYTCPECRSLHHRMREARERYGDRLAVALLPTPRNASCNKYVLVTKPPHELACEYARLALAVWNVRPVAFAEYHNWLMDPPDPPSLADARRQATELIGRDALENALGSERIDRQIEDDARIYHATGQNAIPTLLVKDFVLIGSPSTTDKLCEALEQHGAFDK